MPKSPTAKRGQFQGDFARGNLGLAMDTQYPAAIFGNHLRIPNRIPHDIHFRAFHLLDLLDVYLGVLSPPPSSLVASLGRGRPKRLLSIT